MAPHCFPVTFVQWYVKKKVHDNDSYLNNVFFLSNCHISYSLIAFSQTVCGNEFNTVAPLLGESGGVVNSLDFCPASLKEATGVYKERSR